jgi:hypothetical protein
MITWICTCCCNATDQSFIPAVGELWTDSGYPCRRSVADGYPGNYTPVARDLRLLLITFRKTRCREEVSGQSEPTEEVT